MIYLVIISGFFCACSLRLVIQASSRVKYLESRIDLHLQVHEEMAREYIAIHNVVPFRRDLNGD